MVQYSIFTSIMATISHFKNVSKSQSQNIVFILLLCNIFFISCEKDNFPIEKIIGKWQLVGGYDLMMGGVYSVDTESQRIEEYTKDNIRILYDYLGNEIVRCNFRVAESVITIYGEEISGTKWESNYKYWFSNDTLKIRHVRPDGGFEFYDEFFIHIK